MTSTPSPLGISSNGFVKNVDGYWDTYVLGLSTNPIQPFFVLVSTAASIDYFIDSHACDGYAPNDRAACSDSRGHLYDYTSSTTFQQEMSNPMLQLENYTGPNPYNDSYVGVYGTDTVQLELQGAGGPSLEKQYIVVIDTIEFWMGYLGVLPTTFNTGSGRHPTYFQTLYNQQRIPSLSWGYTAGAANQSTGIGPGSSLTFGGYDLNRFIPNGVTFAMNTTIEQQQILTLELYALTLSGLDLGSETASGRRNVLSSPIQVSLDSTLPYMWLPADACQNIASAFNLTYDEELNLYTVADLSRTALLNSSPQTNISFTFSNEQNQRVDIDMAYWNFDLQGTYPVFNTTNSMYYFPLKNSTTGAYVLGRTFFQGAYVTADFNHLNFSVSQAVLPPNYSPNIVPIFGNVTTSPSVSTQKPSSGSSNAGAIAGGVVGGVLGAALIILLVWFFLLRKKGPLRKRSARTETPTAELPGQPVAAPAARSLPEKSQLPGDGSAGGYLNELPSPDHEGNPPTYPSELDASRRIDGAHELPATAPVELSSEAFKDEPETNVANGEAKP